MILKLILCCYTALFGGFMNCENLTDCFKNATSINYVTQGETHEFQKGDDKFEMILSAFEKTIEGGRPMPAFAVSIDEHTRKDMQSGTWLEFEFETTMEHNEMPFDALLVKVQSDYRGINIIRKYNGKYEGRCFYLDLESDMNDLFETLKNLSASNKK